ncbi:MAG: DUF4139 domain-containing protein [Deltaproteobacteria bacterium]|nr:DUF4139 domain-containing protein [Deltaproteobacteria bacterium]
MRNWSRLGLAAVAVGAMLLPATLAGCRKKAEQPPQVASKLPVQRVVLYRNGVGYFERAGKVTGDEIKFKVRESQVGDFLASLAVVTLDGKPVEFVSFPVPEKKKEKKSETAMPPYPCWPYMPPGAYPGMPPTPPDDGEEEEEPEAQVEVVVKLKGEGTGHDVIIAYVVESPIWRPTYRIVVNEEGGKALLQGWAVVQNLSGEDWEDVQMTVTEGAPLTFRADLGNPFIPARPLVTDRGEVVQAAVSSSVSVSEETRRVLAEMQAEEKAALPVAAAEPSYDGSALYDSLGYLGGEGTGAGYGGVGGLARLEEAEARPDRARRATTGERNMPRGGATSTSTAYPGAPMEQPMAPPPPPPPPQGLTATGAQASMALLALGSQEGGITSYSSLAPVTIRDEASTLVAIFNQTVDASDTLLYRPDAGVSASYQHPFRVVRFTNQAGVTLERGPVAIFGKETFLGQGLLEPLPMGATTSIPYALERGLAISQESGNDVEEAVLVKVVHGTLTIKRYSVRKTKYVVQNLTERSGKLYIQHSRWSGWELKNLPAGSEEVDALTVIVPVDFAAQAKTEIEILERSPMVQEVQMLNPDARAAVRLYLAGAAVDGAMGPTLRRALEIGDEVGTIDTDIQRFTEERQQVQTWTYEVQNNLYSIEGIARAGELRTRLTQRLSELQKRFDELQTKITDLTARRGEMYVELTELLREVDFEVPEPAAPAPAAPAPAAAAPAAAAPAPAADVEVAPAP